MEDELGETPAQRRADYCRHRRLRARVRSAAGAIRSTRHEPYSVSPPCAALDPPSRPTAARCRSADRRGRFRGRRIPDRAGWISRSARSCSAGGSTRRSSSGATSVRRGRRPHGGQRRSSERASRRSPRPTLRARWRYTPMTPRRHRASSATRSTSRRRSRSAKHRTAKPVRLWMLQPLSRRVAALLRPFRREFLLYGALAVIVAAIGAAVVARTVLGHSNGSCGTCARARPPSSGKGGSRPRTKPWRFVRSTSRSIS